MVAQHLLLLSSLLFSSLLVFAAGHPGAYLPRTEESKVASEVVVEGMVYCQSCARAGTWSLTNAEPLPSAKVGIACKDHKNRVKYYKVFQADKGGYFYAELKGLGLNKYHVDDPIHACTAHLLSSPNPDCNRLTNVNSGIEGSPLRDENKTISGRAYKAVIYATGPLAFRPTHCPPVVHY